MHELSSLNESDKALQHITNNKKQKNKDAQNGGKIENSALKGGREMALLRGDGSAHT